MTAQDSHPFLLLAALQTCHSGLRKAWEGDLAPRIFVLKRLTAHSTCERPASLREVVGRGPREAMRAALLQPRPCRPGKARSAAGETP